jgi:hypothetical protein
MAVAEAIGKIEDQPDGGPDREKQLRLQWQEEEKRQAADYGDRRTNLPVWRKLTYETAGFLRDL